MRGLFEWALGGGVLRSGDGIVGLGRVLNWRLRVLGLRSLFFRCRLAGRLVVERHVVIRRSFRMMRVAISCCLVVDLL